MGNSCIVIRSVGSHGNNLSTDAERIGTRAVAELISMGHSILSAHCETGGGSVDLSMPFYYEPSNPEYPARCAYERYLHATDGVNFQGNQCPKWEDLPEKIRNAWKAAADHSKPRFVANY